MKNKPKGHETIESLTRKNTYIQEDNLKLKNKILKLENKVLKLEQKVLLLQKKIRIEEPPRDIAMLLEAARKRVKNYKD